MVNVQCALHLKLSISILRLPPVEDYADECVHEDEGKVDGGNPHGGDALQALHHLLVPSAQDVAVVPGPGGHLQGLVPVHQAGVTGEAGVAHLANLAGNLPILDM